MLFHNCQVTFNVVQGQCSSPKSVNHWGRLRLKNWKQICGLLPPLITENLAFEIFSELFSKSFKNFTLDLPVTTFYFWLVQIKHVSILETIEAFYVVRNTYKVAHLSNFVETIINKKSYEPARAFRDLWSLVMFWMFSNCTRLRLVQFWELSKHHSCP